MADDQDIRAVPARGGDQIATAHFVAGAAFLVVGGALATLALMALRFDGMFLFTYGRLEPMANLSLMIGFGVISLLGGVYYTLPRLTGARLWAPELAGVGLVATTILVVAGLAAIGLGLGDGRSPLALPWWLDLPMLGALSVPFAVTAGSLRRRRENRSYVSVWYLVGGVAWLPLLYLVYFLGDLPFVASVTVAYANVLFGAGFVNMFLVTVGTGLAYFSVVRELDAPLASRQLAQVGFWSLGIAAGWWGAAQLIFGPGPTWLAGVAAALGLAFPIGALVNAANVSLTLEGSWARLEEKPGVSSALTGLYLCVGAALLAGLAGFRSVTAVVSLTGFWEALEFVFLAGVGPLLVAGSAFSAVPRINGRRLYTPARARSFIRLTLVGSIGVLVTMGGAGLLTGYAWIGGSNSAGFVDAGEGWAQSSTGGPEALWLIAIGFALVALLGQLAYASAVLGTITRGEATTQEVLVPVGAPLDEEPEA
ncbi:MAG: cbb3-type cytochrome c oxidase subunit I [Actinobacteria bacterium]|nr:cbb3-type cytochrome c oxidase subunit I [Actinomycetota bacterium]